MSMSVEQYEVLVKRMKLLSKSQSAFLRSHLNTKVSGVVNLVQDSIKVVGATSKDGDLLKSKLEALKLEELNVDVVATQVEVERELKLLRDAVKAGGGGGGGSKAFGASFEHFADDLPAVKGGQAAGNEKTVDGALQASLEEENRKLKALLANATNKTNTDDAPPPLPSAGGAGSQEQQNQIDSLNSELDMLKQRLTTEQTAHEEALQRKEMDLQAQSEEMKKLAAGSDVNTVLEDEVSRLKEEIKTYETKLEEAATSAQHRLENTVKELSEEKDKKISELSRTIDESAGSSKEAVDSLTKQLEELRVSKEELEIESEAEKEKMMDALAEEVDEIEATKNEEIEGLTKKVETLQKATDKAKSQLEKAQQASGKVLHEVQHLDAQVSNVSHEHKTLKSVVKQQLQEYKQVIQQSFGGQLLGKMQSMASDLSTITAKYNKEYNERKKLHNMIQELKGNIRVYMRCRPPSNKELEEMGDECVCVSYPNPGEVTVFNEKNREKTWEFDEVFDFNSKQGEVYRDVSALVTSVMDGYNVCIFAYGQTGSGKTHTMAGPASDRGVNTRALDELFHKSRERSGEVRDNIFVSILEVYNEEIRDLLTEGNYGEKLEIRQGEHGNYVPGLTECPVSAIDDVFELFQQAERNRATASTNMNEHSSRSHMMLTVSIYCENVLTGAKTFGKLNLVDLAGSERINKSGATGQKLKEAQNINKSLSALGDVIAARASKQGHIPFRNSTLTYLLQDCLSKDSKTLMICCISPTITSSEETYCSLNFASRVRTVELGKASKNTGGPSKKAAR